MNVIRESENRTITARHISGNDWEWMLWLPEEDEESFLTLELFLINHNNGRNCCCQIQSIKKCEKGGIIIKADLNPLKNTIDNCKIEKWTVTALGNTLCDSERVVDSNRYAREKEDAFRCRFNSFEAPIGNVTFEDRIIEIVPMCDLDGSWYIQIGEKCLRYMQAFKCNGLDAGFKINKAFFEVACPTLKELKPKGMVVSYKYQLEKDREDHFFPITKVKKEKSRIIATTEMNLENIVFRPLFWDVRMVFEKDGERYWSNVKTPGLSKKAAKPGNRRARLQNLVRTQTINANDGYKLSISETPYNNSTFLVQQDNPYCGLRFRLKERLALVIYRLFKGRLNNKKIFLVHEKFCSAAQDNGWFFFKYCMNNNAETMMDRHIYYVIDRKQPDFAKLEPYKDHVIQFMSLKHMVFSLAARLIISSESKLHSYAWRASESIIRPRILDNKKLVFLQHGVIGLKRVDAFRKGLPGESDLFITSNDMERSFIIDYLDYPPEEVVVTGLSRWDVLEDKSTEEEQKRILLMPTWRKWLDETSDEFFLSSEYYHKYMELINASELVEFLKNNDLYLDFYIHPKLSELLGKFTTSDDRIHLIPFGSEPLNELLMKCRLLVTDYSSVCWDVYYQGKPVIFYQFDLDKYNETQGAYMDLEKDLFGDRAEKQDELLSLLEDAARRDFKLKPEYAKMRKDMYKYIDHNNSRRICEEIMKRGW